MSEDQDASRVALGLLVRLIDLEEEERQRILDEEYPESPEIRERVESWLKHDRESSGAGPQTQVAWAAAELQGDLEGHQPETIGPFDVLEELGHGGQGTVFRAWDPRIQRQVAIKVLRGAFVSDQARRRFRREAEAVAGLDHPGLCSVLEAQVDGDTPYIAMPFITGRSLAAELESAKGRGPQEVSDSEGADSPSLPIPPRTSAELHRILEAFESIARALHVAHEAGVVHRDIKPANLMLTEEGRPIVLDFGLARAQTSEEVTLTQSGDVFGTPPYMSPEQWGGLPEELDRRTDVFSLAVTLFECLTLKRPFTGETPHQLQVALISGPTPNVRSVEVPGQDTPRVLSRDVQVVLERALEKAPARRYGTAEEFAEDLRRIRCYEPIQARPAGVFLRLQRWARRQPAIAAGLAVLLLSLTTGLLGALHLIGQLDRALDNANGLLTSQEALAQTTTDEEAALALAIEGVELSPGVTTRSALLEVLDQCELERVLLAPFARRIYDLDIAPHGHQVALALGTPKEELEHRVLLMDYSTGEVLRQLESEEQSLHSVRFSPDGHWILAGGESGGVELWDLRRSNNTPVYSHQGEPGPVTWAEFSSDGRRFLAQPAQGSTLIYSTEPAGFLRALEVPPGSSGMARFSPDGTRVLVTSKRTNLPEHLPGWTESNRAKLFEVETGRLLTEVGRRPSKIQCADWSPDGRALAFTTRGGFLTIQELEGRMQYAEPDKSSGPMEWVEFSPDGRTVAFTGEDGGNYFAKLHHRFEFWTHTFEGHGGQPLHLAFDPSGKRLLTTGRQDQAAIVWDTASTTPLVTLCSDMQPRLSAWSPDGEYALTLGLNPKVHVWRPGPRPGLFDLHTEDAPGHLHYDRAGEQLLSSDEKGNLLVWDAPLKADPSGQPLAAGLRRRLPGHGEAITVWQVVGTDRLLTGSPNGRVNLWTLGPNLELLQGIQLATGLVDAKLLPGDRVLAVDQAGQLWDLGTGLTGGGSIALPEGVLAQTLHPSPDGTTIAVTGSGGWLGQVDLRNGTYREWRSAGESSRTGSIHAVTWHPQGNLAAYVAEDNLLRFHPLKEESGEPALTWLTPEVQRKLVFPAPQKLRFDRDGKRLLVLGPAGGRVVSVLNLETGEARQSAPALFGEPVDHGVFSAHQGQILVGERNGLVTVLDGETLEPLLRRKHEGAITALNALPDPELNLAASASKAGTIRIWPLDPLPMARELARQHLHGKPGRRTRHSQ